MPDLYTPYWPCDGIWICFQPACHYWLWIDPTIWSNTIQTLYDYANAEGMVPQWVMPTSIYPGTQIPNISPVMRDCYAFTHDRKLIEQSYPKIKGWYEWFLKRRNPTHDGIFAVGDASLGQYGSICEYKDNGTDPSQPNFNDTCNPLTRSKEIGGRPERAYLPDIVACQARMAEDLAMMAQELGKKDEAAHYLAEYHRVRDWANKNLWDEKTKFYYVVERATGKKLMKRSNAAFWLLWAGIPNKEQKDALVAAMFDPKQFFTPIPLPMIALNDPTFNPKCDHWGDGYCWSIDTFHAWNGLLRYGEWRRAAQLAQQYNRGVFKTMEKTYVPSEYYHQSGTAIGCPGMSSVASMPLFFQRYLRDYRAGRAAAEWTRFAPPPLP